MAKNETPISVEELQKQLADAQAVNAAAQEENAALKAELEQLHPTPSIAVIDAKKGLNIRSGPAKTYDILATLPNGTTVEIQQLPGKVEVPGWALIQVGDYIGWAMVEFLKAVE